MAMTWFLAVMLATTLPPQRVTAPGSLTGTVTDLRGGPIPAARVVLRLDATGSETILWTDSAGTYGAESLAAGRYTITIAHPGFKTFVFVDVELQPGLRAAPRAVLELANLREALIRTPPPNPRDYPAWVGPTTRSIRQIEDLARPGRPGSRRPVELPIFVIR